MPTERPKVVVLGSFDDLRSPDVRFLQEADPATSQAKIALARAVSVVISTGLGILGVTQVEEMR